MISSGKRISHVCRIASCFLYILYFFPFCPRPDRKQGADQKHDTHRKGDPGKSGRNSMVRSTPIRKYPSADGCDNKHIRQLRGTHGSTCSQCPPAEAMIVVSEIGEQWSLHTARQQEAIEITIICPSEIHRSRSNQNAEGSPVMCRSRKQAAQPQGK